MVTVHVGITTAVMTVLVMIERPVAETPLQAQHTHALKETLRLPDGMIKGVQINNTQFTKYRVRVEYMEEVYLLL